MSPLIFFLILPFESKTIKWKVKNNNHNHSKRYICSIYTQSRLISNASVRTRCDIRYNKLIELLHQNRTRRIGFCIEKAANTSADMRYQMDIAVDWFLSWNFTQTKMLRSVYSQLNGKMNGRLEITCVDLVGSWERNDSNYRWEWTNCLLWRSFRSRNYDGECENLRVFFNKVNVDSVRIGGWYRFILDRSACKLIQFNKNCIGTLQSIIQTWRIMKEQCFTLFCHSPLKLSYWWSHLIWTHV